METDMPYKISPPCYGVWVGMKQRCLNPNAPQYKHYGGRGIKVCGRWKNSFANFTKDMGERPEGCELERINNDGNYSPKNCRWATRGEQLRNRRHTVRVKIEGKTHLVCDLAAASGRKPDTIVHRAKLGMTLEQVLADTKFHNLGGLALGGLANGAKKKAMTHCVNGHIFSEENTSITKQGWRRCRVCNKNRELARRMNR